MKFLQHCLVLCLALMAAGCASVREFGEGFGEDWTEGGVDVIWSARTGPVSGGNSKIVRAGDELCIVNEEGDVRFFNVETGDMRVAAELDERVRSSGPCTKNTVAVVNSDAMLLVSDLRDGSRSWSRPLNGFPLGSLIGTGGAVISVHPSGETLAFSLQTGDELWSLELPQSGFRFDGSFKPVLDGDRLYLGTPEGSLVAIDTLDGFIAWQSRLFVSRAPDPTANLSLVAGPSLSDGIACASSFNGNTACFEAESGNELWGRELSSASTVAASGELIYLVSLNGSLLGLKSSNGEEVFRVEGASSSRSPLVVTHRNKVVLENGFSGLSVHDPVAGQLLGGVRLRGYVIDIADLDGDGLAILTTSGNLHRLVLN